MSKATDNYTFVFTGIMKMDREHAQFQIRQLGHRSTSAISGKTTHLIVGNDPGVSKLKKAKELGILILNETEFEQLLHKMQESVKKREASTTELLLDSSLNSDFGINVTSDDFLKETHCTFINNTINNDNLPWCEKYRPQTVTEIIGNSGAISEIEKFLIGKSVKNGLLITGTPGLGKTTAVHVLCKKHDILMIEFNASDVRNKKNLEQYIKLKINSHSIFRNKRIILMDEVDGMFSDHGGINELIQIIKMNIIPIICIANDRAHPKIKSLANYCIEVKFKKPVINSLIPRLKSILKAENKSIPDNILFEICRLCNQDLRYIINTLQKNKSITNIKELNIFTKIISKNIFEITSELFSKLTVNQKIELYFEDYSMIPLFVYERYLKTEYFEHGQRKLNPYITIDKIAEYADSISFGDIIDHKIHGQSQNYSLLPYHAIYSCVIPTQTSAFGIVAFPQILGKISSSNAFRRLLIELSLDNKISVDVFTQYSYICIKQIIQCLENNDIDLSINIMKSFHLSKAELDLFLKYYQIDLNSVDKRVKIKFGKECNKFLLKNKPDLFNNEISVENIE